jgi:CDP-glucose 4,6-dehydratase
MEARMAANDSQWQGRRVLVTGCTGFLGSAVTRELFTRGAVVVGLVRDRARGAEFVPEQRAGQFRPVYGRVEDAIRLHTAMAVHEVSAVFHLATADSFGNDRGTAAVLRAAGLYHSKVPVVAARPEQQLRLAGEQQTSPVPVGIARFGEVFGPGDRNAERVVPRTIAALLGGHHAPTGDDPPRDFVFVRDAARACLKLAEAVGTRCESLDHTFRAGWELTGRALAGVVADVVAGKTPTAGECPPNPLDWQPTTTLTEALGETIAWHRESLGPLGMRVVEARKAA